MPTQIRYTLDGSAPTVDSTLYSAPFNIDRPRTVRAVAVRDGIVSPVAESVFTIVPPAPTIEPEAGILTGAFEVTLTARAGDAIYYTINGDTPTTGSTLYAEPFEVIETATVKAIAVAHGVASAVAEAAYTVESEPAEATALFAEMTSEPDSTRKGLISTAIIELKNAGVWAKLDRLWVLAAHDSQSSLLEWKNPTRVITPISGPTFTVDRGWQGNGSQSLDLNFNPSTEGSSFTLNSASCGFYRRTNESAQDRWDMGRWEKLRMQVRYTTTVARMGINRTGVNSASANPPRQIGHFCFQRANATTEQIYHDGVFIGNSTQNTSEIIDSTIYLMGVNSNGSTIVQYSFAYVGAGLSEQEQSDLHAALVTGYLTAIGANV